ncbi:MAG: glycoside hydrolase family 3 protein [Parachlamydiales bacterium]|nr:glycoside hydrolase family 3 protein [Parachlamydiales bacterium]
MPYKFVTTIFMLMHAFFLNATIDDIDEQIATMSLEQKIGQLFIGFVYGETLDDKTKQMLEETKLGNIIYFDWANGLRTPEQVRQLSQQLIQSIIENTGVLPMIAVDQEGGRVQRLHPNLNKSDPNFTDWPGNRAITSANTNGDINITYLMAKALAEELFYCGVNADLAPVADVNDNPNNPVIGLRSFGDDPYLVSQSVKETLKGFEEVGILGVVKHALGHGNTKTDSHTSLPIVEKSIQELEANEFVPFKQNIQEIHFLMTAHVLMPAIDENNCCTRSKKILQDVIRKQWEYEGVIISDSMTMKGIAPDQDTFDQVVKSVQEASKLSFLAGCDCMILAKVEFGDHLATFEENSQMIKSVLSFFKQQVLQGIVPIDRIDQSVKRLLIAKKLNLNNPFDLNRQVDWIAHRKLAKDVAAGAITLISPKELFEKTITQISSQKVNVIAPSDIQEKLIAVQNDLGLNFKALFYENINIQNHVTDLESQYLKVIDQSDLTIFFSINGHLFKDQKKLVQTLNRSKKQIIFVNLSNPIDFAGLDRDRHLTFLTYSSCIYSIKAVMEILEYHLESDDKKLE